MVLLVMIPFLLLGILAWRNKKYASALAAFLVVNVVCTFYDREELRSIVAIINLMAGIGFGGIIGYLVYQEYE